MGQTPGFAVFPFIALFSTTVSILSIYIAMMVRVVPAAFDRRQLDLDDGHFVLTKKSDHYGNRRLHLLGCHDFSFVRG